MAEPIKNLKQFIAQALLWKADPRHADDPYYKGWLYEDTPEKKGIFSWARKTFPLYNKLYPKNNTQLTKAFVRDLNKEDEALLKEVNFSTPNEQEQALTDQFNQQTTEGEAAQADTPATSEGMSFGLPSTSGGSLSTSSPTIHNIPYAPEEPKLVVANKSGYVNEKPSGEIVVANKSGVVAEAPPSEIAIANKSGVITGTHTIDKNTAPQSTPSEPKLVVASKSGVVSEPPPSKIFVANKGGAIVGERPLNTPSQSPRFNFKTPNALKNVGSSLGRSFYSNIGSKLNLNSAINGASKMFGAGGGAASSMLGASTPLLSRAGTGLVNFGVRLSNAPSNLSRSSLTKKSNKKVWLYGISLFMFLFGFSLFSPYFPGGDTPSEASPITGSASDISSCTFTRSGSALAIKSSILSNWISAAAAQGGIPAAVLASVAMHESATFVANADNNHDAIQSGKYCQKGVIFCEKAGQVLHSKDGIDDPCTAEEIAQGAKTAQAVGLMQNLDIYNIGQDLCDIKTNLNLAVTKLKSGGLTSQPTEEQVMEAVRGYYNGCSYGGYSYCNEAWQDLQRCQITNSSNVGVGSGSVPTEKLEQILHWTTQINSSLQPGLPATAWNKMLADISSNGYTATKRAALDRGVGPTGIYWCTNLVIDSYNLSGISGLGPSHQGVRGMMQFWQTTPGYNFIPFDGTASLRLAKPGYALFRVNAGDYNLDHVSIIKSINIDERGNGSISTLDSNSKKAWTITIENGRVLDSFFMAEVVGFGGIL